jgi:gluconate 2-dehydrogenase subunit 3-like protein
MSLGPLIRHLARPTRRRFLGVTLLGAMGCKAGARRASSASSEREVDAAAGPAPAEGARAPGAPARPAGARLAADEWRALEAATARILPSDDGPGAREANVIGFIDRQLGTPELAPIANLIALAAKLLDRWARTRHGGDLAALPPAQQDEVLADLAAGTIPAKAFPQREVFRLLHNLTLEGFLGDPKHGGNQAMVGWTAIGFEPPPLREPGEDPGHHGH